MLQSIIYMQQEGFDLLHDSEERWWNKSRSYVIERVLSRFVGKTGRESICDIGAGYGAVYPILRPYGTVAALEQDHDARIQCRERGYDVVFPHETIGALLPEHAGKFTLIAFFDVLEHVENDAQFLRDAHDLLKKNGRIILTVPAFPSLWSEHDVISKHFRRYRRVPLIQLLEAAGFTVRYTSHWNMLLFFPAVLLHMFGKTGQSSFSLPKWLDALIYRTVTAESWVIPHLSLPFGISLVVLAEKND